MSEASSSTGLSKDTIRYYEKIGLLHPKIKKAHREYSETDLDIMDAIMKLKQTGFSLNEIKTLLDWSKDADHERQLTKEEIKNLKQIKSLFQNKYRQMLEQEKQIKEIKHVLKRADYKIDYLLEKNKQESVSL
ncbi:MerR family transcriptional regulator [Oceanobacillus neutriphilus]|nr:MerR family transcriptional regulator [Oceanobacillus neutriphilus]